MTAQINTFTKWRNIHDCRDDTTISSFHCHSAVHLSVCQADTTLRGFCITESQWSRCRSPKTWLPRATLPRHLSLHFLPICASLSALTVRLHSNTRKTVVSSWFGLRSNVKVSLNSGHSVPCLKAVFFRLIDRPVDPLSWTTRTYGSGKYHHIQICRLFLDFISNYRERLAPSGWKSLWQVRWGRAVWFLGFSAVQTASLEAAYLCMN